MSASIIRFTPSCHEPLLHLGSETLSSRCHYRIFSNVRLGHLGMSGLADDPERRPPALWLGPELLSSTSWPQNFPLEITNAVATRLTVHDQPHSLPLMQVTASSHHQSISAASTHSPQSARNIILPWFPFQKSIPKG